jgi:hypothetical protein
MYSRQFKTHSHKSSSIIKMDPDCAICHAPASHECDCESKGLEVAVKQAEERMMRDIYERIRYVLLFFSMQERGSTMANLSSSTWVRAHAQDYILEYFRLLTERRKNQHAEHIERLKHHAFHYYNAHPHPREIADANAMLKRGIDEDWQSSVQRYPEVLEYFFSLVEFTLPDDDESAVKDPPLSALQGSRKHGGGGGRSNAGTLAGEAGYHEPPERGMPMPRRRTPPIERMNGRPTAPPMGGGGLGYPPPMPPMGGGRRMPYRPPPPGSAFFGPSY